MLWCRCCGFDVAFVLLVGCFGIGLVNSVGMGSFICKRLRDCGVDAAGVW